MPMKAARSGRLAQLLSGLDGALAEFESGLGERWRDTAVVVATEFGRTARINGTEGHRSRHRHHRVARRRCGERRPGDFRLARAETRQSL